MKNAITFLLMLLAIAKLSAQHTDLPNERIFMFTPAMSHNPGDTVYVCGQLLASGSRPVAYSNYVYVELFNRDDSVLVRKKTKCAPDGSFSLPLATDYDWPRNNYYLRAYTRLMQNYHPESFPVAELPLGIVLRLPQENVPGVKCFFYPEGGKLVDGSVQNMTAYLTDGNGAPLETSFYLINDADTLFRGTTFTSGLQTIRFLPQKDKRYHLSVHHQGEYFSFPVPERDNTTTLQAILSRNKIRYQLLHPGQPDGQYRLFIFHPSTGLEELAMTGNQQAGIVDLPDGASGLYVLFLTDMQANPIARNTLWKQPEVPAVTLQKNKFRPRESILLNATFPVDSIRRYHHIRRVGQPALPGALQSEFESELLSPVPFPVRYFSSSNPAAATELDAWLRTTRFVRFDIADLMNDRFQYKYMPETKILFRGLVTRKSGKTLKGGTIVAYNTATHLPNDADIDEQGRYTLPVDDFEDGIRFFLQAHPPKGSADFYDYIPDNDTFPPLLNRLRGFMSPRLYAETNVSYRDSSGFSYHLDDAGTRNYLMPEITVKARTKHDRHVSTEKFYKINYIDENEMDKRNYIRLEDIIDDIPWVSIAWNEDEIGVSHPILVSSRGISTLSGGEVVVLVDDMRMTFEEAMNMISPQQIASIELLRGWQSNAVTFGAINGALVIKTKSGRNSKDIASKGFYYYPIGLTQGEIAKEETIKAPSSPGTYQLIFDMLDEDNRVYSYIFPFTVEM